LIEFAQDVSGALHQVCIRLIDAGGALPAGARTRRFCRGTSAPGDVGCMRAGRQAQTPSPVMPDHHSDGDSVTERSCRCRSTRARSVLGAVA
jgi:hypothetical protein